MKDTDEEIHTSEIEEEDWIEDRKRSTALVGVCGTMPRPL